MRGRRWLVFASVVAVLVGACNNGTGPGPGATTAAPGASAAGPNGSGSADGDLASIAARLTDEAATEAAAADVTASFREQAGLVEFLGPHGQAAFDATDRLWASAIADALTKARADLASPSASATLASYVKPRAGGRARTSSAITVGLIGIFLEPMVTAADAAGKGSFHQSDRMDTNDGPSSATFNWKADYGGGVLQAVMDGQTTTTTGEGTAARSVAETFSLSVTIRPCPDANGKVPVDLTYTEDTTTTGSTENIRLHVKSIVNAIISVDDNAEIAGTAVTSHAEGSESKTTSAGVTTEGGQDSGMTFGLGTDSSISNLDVSLATTTGDADTADKIGNWSRILTVFVAEAVPNAAKTAMKGWQNGACVELTEVTPDSKDVSPQEKVDITAHLKHNVTDEDLSKPVKAQVEGKGSIDPTQADGPKVKFTYTAGTNYGDVGTVTLRAVSNRGIATRVLVYTIRAKWTLSAKGTHLQTYGGAGFIFGAQLNVVVDEFQLTEDPNGGISGTGSVHFAGKPIFPAGFPCTGTYNSDEKLNVTGNTVTYADGTVKLHLVLSAPPGSGSSTVSCPGISSTIPIGGGGGFGGNAFNNTISTIELLAAGETLKVDETGTSSVWQTHTVLTFTLSVVAPNG